MLTVSGSEGVFLWVIRTNKSLMSLSFLKDQADVQHRVVAERVRDTKKSDRRETSLPPFSFVKLRLKTQREKNNKRKRKKTSVRAIAKTRTK